MEIVRASAATPIAPLLHPGDFHQNDYEDYQLKTFLMPYHAKSGNRMLGRNVWKEPMTESNTVLEKYISACSWSDPCLVRMSLIELPEHLILLV